MITNEAIPSSAGPYTQSHETNASVTSLALSPDHCRLVIVGRDIFKILAVDQTPFKAQDDIRAALKSIGQTPAHHGPRSTANSWDSLTIKDVQWMHGSFDRKVVTAAANGQIVLYDLDREGYESSRLHQHNRQVHRLSINPVESGLLLSASQDSTVRLWDLRTSEGYTGGDGAKRNSACFYGNSGPVRDVKWSPKHFHEFALGTDGGMVQKWDIRKPNAPILRVTAHGKPCSTIDWHPNGRQLLSAGADKDIKVWDFSSFDRRIKPLQSMRAPQAMTNVRWQPAYDQISGEEKEAWQTLLIAASFDHEDPRILLWDLRSPHVPKHIVYLEEGPATCMLWQSPTILWSADGHGALMKTDVSRLPTKSPYVAGSLAAVRPNGEMTQLVNKSTIHARVREGPDPILSRPTALLSAIDVEPEDTLDFSVPTELVPHSQVSDLKLAGLFVDVEVLDFTVTGYRDMAQLPNTVSSDEVHFEWERTMLYNADIAAKAAQPNRSNHWIYLSLLGKTALEIRANAKKKLRAERDTASSYEPTDFLPNDRDEYVSCLPQMQGLVGKLIEESDHTMSHLQMVVYILINLVPWFPLRDHPCSQQTARDNIVQHYHDWLCRLNLYTAACALRKSWARVSPSVVPNNGIANATHAKLFCMDCQKVIKGSIQGKCDRCNSLVFVCAYCNIQTRQGLWFWCQRCGHGGHMACMKGWFLREGLAQSYCPTVGCQCRCIPGAEEE